jgi:hypothetical protein
MFEELRNECERDAVHGKLVGVDSPPFSSLYIQAL